jgi:hypothetical protein
MLEEYELELISAFARFVDCSPQARAKVVSTSTLDEVVALAHSLGYHGISVKLLLKVGVAFSCSDWVWRENGARWSDHVFSLALAMLTAAKSIQHRDLQCSTACPNIIYNDEEAEAFYEYAQKNEEIQEKLKCSRSINEVVRVARQEGFRLRKIDFIIRKREWQDSFFPWGGMPYHKVSEFMHRDELEVPPPPLLEDIE